MGKHKQRADNNIEKPEKLKIQVNTKKLSIPEAISFAVSKLNEFAGPELKQLERAEGEPKTKIAALRKQSMTKKGMLNLWYEVGWKA